jgi:hypothetical protein
VSLNLTGTIGDILDTLSGLFGKAGLTYEFFEYNNSAADQAHKYVSVGTVVSRRFALTGDDETTQQIFITDDAVVAAIASASITLVSQTNVGDELTVGGKVYTFVASGAVGDQINIGANITLTAANIAAKVTADTLITLCTATSTLNVVNFSANNAGTNDIDLESDGTRITGTEFTGGTPTLDNILNDVTGAHRVTHVKIGTLYYAIVGTPDRPLESLDAIRYWLVRCEHTGVAALP